MTDREAFLTHLREHEDDHTTRMVYADWLDEHDEPEEASRQRAFPELKSLAKKCPPEYPMGRWDAVPEVVALSKACERHGFPNLAKAVLGGLAWSRDIAAATGPEAIVEKERSAIAGHWSWNDPKFRFRGYADFKPKIVSPKSFLFTNGF